MTERITEVGPGVALCWERIGDPGADPLLLVAGLGRQAHGWRTGFCERLADRGYQVIRFDNRDVGRSTRSAFPPPGPAAIMTGRWSPRQYDLGDMAGDTVGLIDALGFADAHLVGVSMGGMIAQTVAALAPARVRTLTSIMSTTGACVRSPSTPAASPPT